MSTPKGLNGLKFFILKDGQWVPFTRMRYSYSLHCRFIYCVHFWNEQFVITVQNFWSQRKIERKKIWYVAFSSWWLLVYFCDSTAALYNMKLFHHLEVHGGRTDSQRRGRGCHFLEMSSILIGKISYFKFLLGNLVSTQCNVSFFLYKSK